VFDTTADVWPTWLGLVAASLAVAGVAAGLPAAPPPDPDPVAATIDAVAASDHPERETVAVDAEEVRIEPRRLTLRSHGGTAHAALGDPVVPVRGPPLERVLDGAPPDSVFDSPTAFRRALREARGRESRLRPAPTRLTVRRVHWGGVHATLVG